MNKVLLSVIIPVRSTKNYDIIQRISWKLLDSELSDNIEFIIVDDGSDEESSIKIKTKCNELGFKYIFINSRDQYFSLARARNEGVRRSLGKYIMIEDVDYVPYIGYYNDILYEIELFDFNNKCEDFFTIPCIWLTEEASISFLNNNSKNNAKKLIHKYLEYDLQFFEFGIPAGSIVVMSRHHYLSIGGQNEKFNRWGFEDHEFANRLLCFSNKFRIPNSQYTYIENTYDNYTEYKGFRARYRLYGDLVCGKGIWCFHINHPISNTFRNNEIKKQNREVFEICTKEIQNNPYYLSPLYDPFRGRTCITSKNPYIWNNELIPLYGELYFFDDELHSKEEFYQFIIDNKIDRVVMQNPYTKENKFKIYKYLKQNNIEVIVAERGALPESVYFDNTGFCCESKMYSENLWNKELDPIQYNDIIEYIKDYKASGKALEKQNSCIGGVELRKKLGIGSSQNVLFVVFQTRKDTTIKYFSGKIGTYDNFINLVNDTYKKLPYNWTIVYKNHPLEVDKVNIPGAICLDNYHINDILEASNMVLLMNSGCGILALMYGLPVLHVSKAQYDCPYFNRYISSSSDVINYCNNIFNVDIEKSYRFLYYLVFEFYSFAKNIYKKRPGKPESWPVQLIFNKIVFPGVSQIKYGRDKNKAIWKKSILYDRYRTSINEQEKNKNVNKYTTKNIPKVKKKFSHKIENIIMYIFLSHKKYIKYHNNRDIFFKDSKNFIVKNYYRINNQ